MPSGVYERKIPVINIGGRFVSWRSMSERFCSNIIITPTCWIWDGPKIKAGYGYFDIRDKRYLAHRISYEIHRGWIPAGLQLDHLCRVRHCVNPWHLEPVTAKENMHRGINNAFQLNAKKTHCKKNHPYSAENTSMLNGSRRCLRCHSDQEVIRRRKRKLLRVAL